ncbi:hypothetical protein CCP4SC76_960002 [Gammaproteobacteria bacterium]
MLERWDYFLKFIGVMGVDKMNAFRCVEEFKNAVKKPWIFLVIISFVSICIAVFFSEKRNLQN